MPPEFDEEEEGRDVVLLTKSLAVEDRLERAAATLGRAAPGTAWTVDDALPFEEWGWRDEEPLRLGLSGFLDRHPGLRPVFTDPGTRFGRHAAKLLEPPSPQLLTNMG